MKQEEQIREIFLKEFIRALIKNSAVINPPKVVALPPAGINEPPSSEAKKTEEKKAKEEYQKSILQTPKKVIKIIQPIKPVQRMQAPKPPVPRQLTAPRPQLKKAPIQQMPAPISPPPQAQTSINIFETVGPSLERIKPMILDESIISIECTGPGNPIIINKQGLIEPTNILLTTEEISEIMKEISKKTKIPLVPGVFRAVLGNIMIIAVNSDFVGIRFIIQKRAPFSAAQSNKLKI